MSELRVQKKSEEMQIIANLYDDQEGRAESIERHIDFLEQKRQPKTMTEIFQALTDAEKVDIEKNWGTSLDELKVLAERHDAKVLDEAIPDEEKRSKQHDKMLANVDMNQIMSMAVGGGRQAVEYKDSETMSMPVQKD